MISILKKVSHIPVIRPHIRKGALLFFTAQRWLSNSLSGTSQPYKVWTERHFKSEEPFWDQWFATKGLDWPDDYRERVDPNTLLREDIGRLLSCNDPKILDVGAGPITVLGKIWNGKRLNITAIDPMGDEYAKILRKHNIVPAIPTIAGPCSEELNKLFSPNTFDFSFAQNCLDHGYDPARSVEQMVEVTKPGGTILLRHAVNEGKNELYSGEHQWNFHEKAGELVVSSPGVKSRNISRMLSARVTITISYDPDSWMRVVMRKCEPSMGQNH